MANLPVKRVLIVDDEPLIVRLLEMYLNELGVHEIVKCPALGPLMVEIDRGGFDLAILDVNLCGKTSFPAAQALAGAGTPFFFVSDYVHEDMPEALRAVPLVSKPYLAADIEAAIRMACAQAARA